MTRLVLILLLLVGYCFLGTCFGKRAWRSVSSKETKGPTSRVKGGERAKLGEFPFMLRVADNNGDGCGAVLISPTCALTAAHCVHDRWYSTIIAGDWNADKWEESEQVIDGCATVHPDYNPDTLENDIAFLRTWTPFETGNKSLVRPIDLPAEDGSSVPSTSFNATVMGWGWEAGAIIGRQRENLLQKALVSTWSDQDCREVYGNETIKDSMLCAAGNEEEDVEIFEEDSGSPLIMNSDVGRPTLVGLISWSIRGFRGGAVRYPGVYTEVTYFMPWIQGLMNQNASQCYTY